MPHRRRVLATVTLSTVTLSTVTLAAALAMTGCSAGAGAGQASGSTGSTATATGTSCTWSGCTVVLQQGVDARTSVLGVPVELVGVTGNQVTLKVANQQVDVPLDPNTSAKVGGLAVSVQSVDKDRVVLKVTAGG